MRTAPGFVQSLDQLRAGTLSFTRFARTNTEHFRAWSMAIVRRKKCEHVMSWLGLDDLTQHALLACWRAVDTFDPTAVRKNGKATTLHTYVAYRVGHAVEQEVVRAAGWPRRDRKRQPIRQVDPHDFVTFGGQSQEDRDDRDALERCAHEAGKSVQPVASTRLYAAVARTRFGNGLALDVVVGALEGGDRNDIAAAVYADPERRLRYQLDCEQHARVRVGLAFDLIGTEMVGRD